MKSLLPGANCTQAYLRIGRQQVEQRLRVAQADGIHPVAADRHRVVMEGNQQEAFAGAVDGAPQQLQLILLEIARHRAGNARVEQHHAPVADVDDLLQQVAALGRPLHRLAFVVVTGEPAQRRVQGGAQPAEACVGIEAAVLGDVAGGENQVDPRLLPGDPLDHLLQAMGGIHAKQARAILGEQVAVRKLHQQYGGVGGGSVRMA